MSREPTSTQASYLPCDLCGCLDAEFFLESDRLDGPLVRCRNCGLVYVGVRQEDFTFASADEEKSRRLKERVYALGLVDDEVEAHEAPVRRALFAHRLGWLQNFIASGRLLEVGCAEGEFLVLARSAGFDVVGIEPDPVTSARARQAHRLDVITGTLADSIFADASFDLVVMFHVIEHVNSPRAALEEIYRVLKPQGFLFIETPNIETPWLRIFRRRWRHFIPDHYYFFSPRTLRQVLEAAGFTVRCVERVGKLVSLRLLADRLRRMNPLAGKLLSGCVERFGIAHRTIWLNLGDILLACAQKPEQRLTNPPSL